MVLDCLERFNEVRKTKKKLPCSDARKMLLVSTSRSNPSMHVSRSTFQLFEGGRYEEAALLAANSPKV